MNAVVDRLRPQTGQQETTQSDFERMLSKESGLSSVTMGFDNAAGFALLQRAAKVLNKSSMVPPQYRETIEKKGPGGSVSVEENPSGLANCIVALNMAARLKADPLMIMQNLYIVEGRPSWSSQYIIAAINSSGKFSPLRFDIKELGEREAEYQESYWENGRKNYRTKKIKVMDMECIAWVVERESGQRLESTPITIGMAVAEGWYQKSGSKWQTMPGQMIRYRAAAFFGRIYAPELLMGLRTYEEEQDMIAAVREVAEAAEEVAKPSGSSVVSRIRREEPAVTEVDQDEPAKQDEPPVEVNSETGEIQQDPHVSPAVADWTAAIGEVDASSQSAIGRLAHDIRADKRLSKDQANMLIDELRARQTVE